MDILNELQMNLKKAENAKNIDELRISFIGISISIIQIKEIFQPLKYSTYVQHCPMANNDKGADWLSKEKEIRNPFFGSSMLSCGEVK
jgi:Cu(I)/Ag(I) efflux system membrane fusion protein